jgi:hypothetical protein
MSCIEPSFATLFRASRFASFDRTIPQAYTAPKRLRERGEWGFKRNLPPSLATAYITVADVDTTEHQTVFSNASSKVSLLKRWKESFPSSMQLPPVMPIAAVDKCRSLGSSYDRKNDPIFDLSKHESRKAVNLADLSDSEFAKLLKTVKERRAEWRKQVAAGTVAPQDWRQFFNIEYGSNFGLNKKRQAQRDGVVNSDTVKELLPFSSEPHPPQYSFQRPLELPKVMGRCLKMVTGSPDLSQMTVGVQGIVTTAEGGSSHQRRGAVSPFFVTKAQMGSKGVLLGVSQSNPTESFTLSDGEESVFELFKDHSY